MRGTEKNPTDFIRHEVKLQGEIISSDERSKGYLATVFKPGKVMKKNVVLFHKEQDYI